MRLPQRWPPHPGLLQDVLTRHRKRPVLGRRWLPRRDVSPPPAPGVLEHDACAPRASWAHGGWSPHPQAWREGHLDCDLPRAPPASPSPRPPGFMCGGEASPPAQRLRSPPVSHRSRGPLRSSVLPSPPGHRASGQQPPLPDLPQPRRWDLRAARTASSRPHRCLPATQSPPPPRDLKQAPSDHLSTALISVGGPSVPSGCPPRPAALVTPSRRPCCGV